MASNPLLRASRIPAFWTAAVIFCCGILSGCGKPGPDVQMVAGSVTLDDQPLADATVIFAPMAPGGLAAIGRTGGDGRFQLSARVGKRYGQGTVPGEYKVVVSKREVIEEPEQPPEDPPDRPIEPKELLPRRYTSESTTPFRATVEPGTNEFSFELSSSGK